MPNLFTLGMNNPVYKLNCTMGASLLEIAAWRSWFAKCRQQSFALAGRLITALAGLANNRTCSIFRECSQRGYVSSAARIAAITYDRSPGISPLFILRELGQIWDMNWRESQTFHPPQPSSSIPRSCSLSP